MTTSMDAFKHLFPRFKAVNFSPIIYSRSPNGGIVKSGDPKYTCSVVISMNRLNSYEHYDFTNISEAKSWLYDMLQKYPNIIKFELNKVYANGIGIDATNIKAIKRPEGDWLIRNKGSDYYVFSE